jgi:hypothetical protein
MCNTQSEGKVRYNTARKLVEFCNGTGWTTLEFGEAKGKQSEGKTLEGTESEGTEAEGTESRPARSCSDIAKRYKSSEMSGPFWIRPSESGPTFETYCDAEKGWTLIMKIDGEKQTFNYDSRLWLNKETFKKDKTWLDDTEAKFASYWEFPFTELRLGMKFINSKKWIVIKKEATSLYSLIADGTYRKTSIGKSTWMDLLGRASLQDNCNREGFNARSNRNLKCARARIGIISNNEFDCDTCPDSFLGFGTSYLGSARNSAGNFAVWLSDTSDHESDVNVKVFGYIMAR